MAGLLPAGHSGSHASGFWGEAQAAKALRRRGYTIIGQRIRVGRRDEIDMVARHDNTLVFVEVKTRKTETFGRPAAAVTSRKRHCLRAAPSDTCGGCIRRHVLSVRCRRSGRRARWPAAGYTAYRKCLCAGKPLSHAIVVSLFVIFRHAQHFLNRRNAIQHFSQPSSRSVRIPCLSPAWL